MFNQPISKATTITLSLALKVSDTTGLHLMPGGAGGGTPNVIGRSASNIISATVRGGVIGGGGNASDPNHITADYATVPAS